MIDYENKLAHLPKTKAYLDFGLEQVEIVNNKFDFWLSQQAFSNDNSSSKFGHMTLKGLSNYTDFEHKKSQDEIEWDLKFAKEIKNKLLNEALLHIHRIPNITTYNSKPRIFDTADYIQIAVFNSERGWVEKGKFPKNVYCETDYDSRTEENICEELPLIGVQTDIRREALAGFNAAYYWQCFREMALVSSDYITEQLKKEGKKLDSHDYDGWEHMRSRREGSYPFFVGLLPDVRLKKGPASLKPFYKPGLLEGAFTLELENFKYHQFGSSETGGIRPIYTIKSFPIEIFGKDSKNYNALIKFSINMFGYSERDEKQVESIVEKQLQKRYNIKMDSPSRMNISFEMKNANKISEEIKEGSNETDVHKFVRDFGNVLVCLRETYNAWENEKIPELKKDYEVRVNESREKHFSDLESKLSKKISE